MTRFATSPICFKFTAKFSKLRLLPRKRSRKQAQPRPLTRRKSQVQKIIYRLTVLKLARSTPHQKLTALAMVLPLVVLRYSYSSALALAYIAYHLKRSVPLNMTVITGIGDQPREGGGGSKTLENLLRVISDAMLIFEHRSTVFHGVSASKTVF